MRDIEKVNVFE